MNRGPGDLGLINWPFLVEYLAVNLVIIVPADTYAHGMNNIAVVSVIILIKSPQSGVTLCFQFVSAASATAGSAKTFASHVKTIWAKP